MRWEFSIKSKTWRTLILLLFFFTSQTPREARKQENLLIDLIPSDFWGVTFQSAVIYKTMKTKTTTRWWWWSYSNSCAESGKGVCFKSSAVHLRHSFLCLWNVLLFEAGPSSLCFSEPRKTPHSWQQIITGMKRKVEPFTVRPFTPPLPHQDLLQGK